MILGRIGEEVKEDFTVLDENNSLVTGIDETSFTVYIYSPSNTEISHSVGLNIIELGGGHYRLKFTPNSTGIWYVNIYHTTYFPWGKAGTVQVFSNDFDTMTTLIKRILGLVQENFFIDNTSYNTQNMLTYSRIRIYSNALSVGTDSNVISTYIMEADYDSSGLQMTSYKVTKQ